MAIIKDETHSKIVKIDLDTAEYIIEKVIRAVEETVNETIVLSLNLTTNEMFTVFSNQLVNILNKIKEKKEMLEK